MSYTTSAAIEMLMRQRVADRLHEAENDHLASLARRAAAPTTRPLRRVVAIAVSFARLLTTLI